MKNKLHMSPWMTIGASILLMLTVTVMGVVNYNRDKNRMGRLLNSKGAALIRSFEAGARTGMMGRMGRAEEDIHLQRLIEETAGQPDIAYISIVDSKGTILAHNDQSLIGKQFVEPALLAALSPSDLPQWRIVGKIGGRRYFEVFKRFSPLPDTHDGRHHPMPVTVRGSQTIFIAMSITPFETAMAEDLSHNLVMAAIIVALGIAGIISLFWSQSVTKSRKQLEETRKLASELITHLPEGIMVMDTHYRVIYSNKTAWGLLGLEETKESGIDARSILPQNIWALYDTIKSGTVKAEKEIRLFPKPDTPVPVAVSGADIHSQTGDYIGFMFLFKDLTEIKELELKNQRIEKLATVGNLAAGIAHEIRNPLSAIKGYVTFFGSLFEKGSENRNAAELMTEEVDRVNRVITELLEFARPSDLELAPVRVADLINHSVRIITHEAKNAGVSVSLSINDDLPDIEADIDRLTQVFLNLYINAIQAMPKGGTMTVSASFKDREIRLEVQDTGMGMAKEVADRIFDPYFTTKNNGTGLGLAIARKIVEDHGGTITARSKTGSGTKITVMLPSNR